MKFIQETLETMYKCDHQPFGTEKKALDCHEFISSDHVLF